MDYAEWILCALDRLMPALAVLAGVNCLAVVALAWACCAVSGRGDGQGGEA